MWIFWIWEFLLRKVIGKMVKLTFSLLDREFYVGDQFGFNIVIEGPNRVNAAQVNIVYNDKVLELVDVEYRLSEFPTQVAEIRGPGTLRMARTILGNHVSGSNIFATLVFRAIAPGRGFVNYASGCKVADVDTEQDVLNTLENSNLTILDTPGTLTVLLQNTEKVRVELHPVSESGKSARVDGTPEWVVLSGTSTVERSPDGMAAYLISSDNPGDTQILVKADADLGSGREEISGIILVRVVGSNPESMGLSFGSPESK